MKHVSKGAGGWVESQYGMGQCWTMLSPMMGTWPMLVHLERNVSSF